MEIAPEDQSRQAVQASASVAVVVVEAYVGNAEEWERRMVRVILLRGRQDQIDGRSHWRAAAAAALGSH